MEQDFYPWVYNNYIQTKCAKYDESIDDLEYDFMSGNIFGGIDYLDYYIYKKENIVSKYSNLNQCIINAINMGLYFYTFVDLFYIPNTAHYKCIHYSHDILVLGYNTYKSCFNVMHFTIKGDLSVFEVSFNDFNNAFLNASISPSIVHHLVILFKRNNEKYTFNIDLIKSKINNYLESKDISNENDMYFSNKKNMYYDDSVLQKKLHDFIFIKSSSSPKVWGINTYKELEKYYNNPLFITNFYDIRPLHALWEHKKSMLVRIEFLLTILDNNNLKELYIEFLNLEKLCLELRNCVLKYNIIKTNDQKLNESESSKISKVLIRISDVEYMALNKLYSIL